MMTKAAQLEESRSIPWHSRRARQQMAGYVTTAVITRQRITHARAPSYYLAEMDSSALIQKLATLPTASERILQTPCRGIA